MLDKGPIFTVTHSNTKAHASHRTHWLHSPQVLHVVMYPRPEFDFPILGLDVVGSGNNRFSLAVLDACPVSADRSLAPPFVSALRYALGSYNAAP